MNDNTNHNNLNPPVAPAGAGKPPYYQTMPISEAEKRRKDYPYQPADAGLVLATLVLGYLFIEWVLFGGGGVGITAFSVLFLGTMLWWMGTKGVKLTRQTLPWLGVAGALALYPAISDNRDLKLLSVLVLMVMVCYLAAALGDTRAEGGLGQYFAADCGSAMFKMPFGNYGGAFRAISTTAKKQKGSRHILYLVIGLVSALPLLIIAGGLLQQADAAFAALWSKITDSLSFGSREFTVKMMLAFPVALYLFALITAHVIHRGRPGITAQVCDKAGENAKVLPEMMLVGITVPLLLLYTVFFFSQSAYFLSALSGLAPQGMLPAEYARRGFFELCQVSAINLAAIALFRLLSKSRNKVIPLLLCFFSVGMIVLSLSKMLLYIRLFGLTPKRVYTSWFMIFLLIVFVLTAISQIKPRMAMTGKLVLIGLSMFLLLCYANTDKVIAAYNLNAYESGRMKALDAGIFDQLGYGSIPYLEEALSSSRLSGEQRQYLEEILERRRASIPEHSWTALTLDHILANR